MAGTSDTTAKCSLCGKLVRYATLAATGKSVAIEPVGLSVLVGFDPHEPWRNLQEVRAFQRHAACCPRRRRSASKE